MLMWGSRVDCPVLGDCCAAYKPLADLVYARTTGCTVHASLKQPFLCTDRNASLG